MSLGKRKKLGQGERELPVSNVFYTANEYVQNLSALNAFYTAQEKAVEVFELIRRLNGYIEYEKGRKSNNTKQNPI